MSVTTVLELESSWNIRCDDITRSCGQSGVNVGQFCAPGQLWRRDRRARRHTQSGQGVDDQRRHLHCGQVLLLPLPDGHLGCPPVVDLGLPVCLYFILPHLGCGSVYQELFDGVTVSGSDLLTGSSHLRQPHLWVGGEDVQPCKSGFAQGSISPKYWEYCMTEFFWFKPIIVFL